MPTVEERLSALPDSLAQLIRDAIAISAARSEHWDEEFEQRNDAAWTRAMTAAGFERASGRFIERVIPLAEELKPEQRAVLEILALIPGLPLGHWPVYAAAWLRRRGLGIDPPGVLFSPIEWEGRQLPLLHVLRSASTPGKTSRPRTWSPATRWGRASSCSSTSSSRRSTSTCLVTAG